MSKRVCLVPGWKTRHPRTSLVIHLLCKDVGTFRGLSKTRDSYSLGCSGICPQCPTSESPAPFRYQGEVFARPRKAGCEEDVTKIWGVAVWAV